MAVEAKRACGYRKVGGLYLEGGGLGAPCDRLPLAIIACEICGAEPRFTRGIAKINPARLWGVHQPCGDKVVPCPICEPGMLGFMMWVGGEYTASSFIEEAGRLGVSKRIPAIPKDLKVGEHWIYLARLGLVGDSRYRSLDGIDGPPEKAKGPGIFYAFKPQKLVKVITQSQADAGDADKLREQGITPLVVPDDDLDHRPRKARGLATAAIVGDDDGTDE